MYIVKLHLDSIIYFFCILLVPAILYSKALITICYIIIAIGAIIKVVQNGWFNPEDKSLFFYLFLFVMILVSGFNSEDLEQWMHHVIIKVPFLLMPLAFSQFNFINEKKLIEIHVWLIVALIISSVPVVANYTAHKTELLAKLAQGQPIPTPIEHVKYSMMNAYGVLSGLMLTMYYKQRLSPLLQVLLPIGTFMLFIYMHVLAVRTGLAIVYIFCLLWIIYYLLQKGVTVSLARGILYGVLAVIFMWLISPSLITKFGYVKYDWEMYAKGEGNLYSDSERIQSLQIGYDLYKDNKLWGVGMGDLKVETAASYEALGRGNYFNYPHSEFMYILSAMGIVGLILFLLGFFGPVFQGVMTKNIFLLLISFNYGLSFLVENSIERSVSIAFFLLFALMSIMATANEKKGEIKKEPNITIKLLI